MRSTVLSVTTHHNSYTPEEITTQLRNSKTRVLFTHADVLDKAVEAVKDAPSVQDIFVLGDQVRCVFAHDRASERTSY